MLVLLALGLAGVVLGMAASAGVRAMTGLGVQVQLPLGPQARVARRRNRTVLVALVSLLLLFPALMLLTHALGALLGQ